MLFVTSIWVDPIGRARPSWRPTIVPEALAVNLAVFSVTATIHGYLNWFTRAPRTVLLIGVLLAGAGISVAGIAIRFNVEWLYYASFGAIAGAGIALVDMSASQNVLDWSTKKGFGGAWFAVSAGAGSLILTAVAYETGQRWDAFLMVMVFAAILFVTGLPWIPFVQALPPGAMGTPPMRSRDIVFSVTFLMTSIVFFANVFIGWAVLGNLSGIFQAEAGVSYGQSVTYTLICLGVYCFGRLICGPLSDLLTSKKLAMVLIMLPGSGAAIFLTVTTHLRHYAMGVDSMVAAFSIILFSYGGMKSSIGAYFTSHFGKENLGSVLGLHAVAYGLGVGCGPIFLAHFPLATYSIVAVSLYAAAILAATIVRPLETKAPYSDTEIRSLMEEGEDV